MNKDEEKLIDRCIEAHYNKEREWCDECFDIEIINESR
jgi:coproporphyrinogen III oxidase